MTKQIKNGLLWILLALAIIWSFFPIFYVISSSFKPPTAIFTYPPTIVSAFTMENYKRLICEWPEFFHALGNSAMITLFTICLTLSVTLPAGYAYSRFKGRGLKLSSFFLIAIRMFPPIIITIPLFPVLCSLNLIDKHITLIILYTTFMVSLITWILKSFIDTVPIELEEAALIDGCNRFQAFVKVTLPVLAPILIASAIIVAAYTWNEFLFAFIFTRTNARTAPMILNEMLGSFLGPDWGALFSATTFQLVPILIFVWIIQRYLVKGMTMGAIKG